MVRPGIAISILFLVLSATPVAAAPPPGGWNGPDVYAGEKAGPIAIGQSDSTFTTIASLAVPVGTWVAFAKFDARVPEFAVDISCEFVAGAGASQTRQRGSSRVGIGGEDELGSANFSFNLEHTFTNLAGKFILRCRAEASIVTANFIRIMAIRVGTMTKRPLGGGAPTTAGSGKPVIVHGYRNVPVSIPNSDTLGPVAAMPLPAGKWWIRADFTVFQLEGTSVPHDFGCQLEAGDQKDAVFGQVTIDNDSTMVDFNLVTSITPRRTLDDVRLRCRVEGSFEARDVRITALQLGTVTNKLFTNGSSTTTGSGLPTAMHGQRFLAPDLTTSYATLGQIGLNAGKWLVSAKVSAWDGHAVQCRLRDGIDADQAYEEFPSDRRTMAMHIADAGRRSRQLSIACRNPLGPSENHPVADIRYVKVTAIRVATLTLRDL